MVERVTLSTLLHLSSIREMKGDTATIVLTERLLTVRLLRPRLHWHLKACRHGSARFHLLV